MKKSKSDKKKNKDKLKLLKRAAGLRDDKKPLPPNKVIPDKSKDLKAQGSFNEQKNELWGGGDDL